MAAFVVLACGSDDDSGGGAAGSAGAGAVGGSAASGGSGGSPASGGAGGSAGSGGAGGSAGSATGGGSGSGGSSGSAGTAGAAGTPGTTWVTYLGGSAFEQARDATVDSGGNVIVVGGTASANFPVTSGAYDTSFATGGTSLGTGGPMDVFVAKYAPDGTLLWATFLGGPNYDRAYAVETDAAGDIYVAGRAGDQFPTTAGALQPSFAGDNNANSLYGQQDGFVAKLSADGKQLLWSTYVGGPGREFIRDVDIDSSGNVYAGVSDAASGFPHVSSGAFDTTHNGGTDTAIVKLAPGGQQLVWGTFFGGSGNESVPSVRVDGAGQLYLATTSNSPSLPITPGAYQQNRKGGDDFFVTKFAADGKSLVFSTWYGGSGNEGVETHQIALDAAGDAVIGAGTNSTDLPTTANAFQKTLKGTQDGWLAKISADGTALLAATYFGGNGIDALEGIAVDSAGNVYAGGATRSTDLPSTSGAHQSSAGANKDGWAAWLAPDLSAVSHLTYLAGGQDDEQRSLWIDSGGNIVSTGQTASSAFPITSGAAQQQNGGGAADAYVAKLIVH